MTTFNDYSTRFYKKFYNIDKFDKKINNSFNKNLINFKKRKNLKKNIDDQNVYSNVNNPLTIKEEIFEKVGLKCEEYIFTISMLSLLYMKKNFQKYFTKSL